MLIGILKHLVEFMGVWYKSVSFRTKNVCTVLPELYVPNTWIRKDGRK